MAKARKQLGQHFLTDPRILARIADAATVQAGDSVLEIGPGHGGLTAELARRAGRVVAIEKDRELAARLVGRWPNVTVITEDALAVDWHAAVGVPRDTSVLPRHRIVGNIPYNITSALIDKALTPPRPALIAFLVQREVADRIGAVSGTRAYGALSVGVQAVATVEVLLRVAAGSFTPPPEVESALLRLIPLSEPVIVDSAVASFRRLVVGLFGFRRKQLRRGLRELTGWSADRAAGLLREAGVDPTARPEMLGPPSFAAIHGALVDAGWSGN